MEEKEIIASNITYYRKKLGLSQLELAEKINYSNKNISKWEKAETTPSIFTLKRLAEIFGISLDKLISPIENISNSETDNCVSIKKSKHKPLSLKAKYVYLIMANAILIMLAFIAIYVLAALQIKRFNRWYLLLYITPLCALSITIFIRCVYKYVDFISISFISWLTALSIYLSNINAPNIYYIFFIAAALQVLLICIALLVNFHLGEKFKKGWFRFWKKTNRINDDDKNNFN